MLLSHREIVAARLGAGLATSAILHRTFRVHAVDNRAVVSEDRLMLRAFERRGFVGRPCATVLLEGRARISAYDRTLWIHGPAAVLMDFKSAIAMRQEGPRYRSLVLEWDVPALGERPEPFADVSTPPLCSLSESLWSALRATREARAPVAVEAALRQWISALRDAGAPLSIDARTPLHETVDEHTEQLSRALDHALSAMDDQPMVVDIAETLALSPRQLQRIVTAFHERYGFNSGTWQDTRSRRRVMMGAALMTVASASAEYVSKVVGYRSPQSFARALHMAGLPAPAQIFDETAKYADHSTS
jgi:AraC-like DNA-binding protein